MAVTGFLSILNDQLKEIGSGDNDEQAAAAESVAFEILGKKKHTYVAIPSFLKTHILLGLLRRCFSQQCEIRISVYNGLGSLSQQYPSFSGDIFELLYTQVHIYKTYTYTVQLIHKT